MTGAPAPAATGHPPGLRTLFFTELWERFSYYGMRALLVLFLVDAGSGLGLDDQAATAIYGLYTAAVYIVALPGGWIADRLLGAQRAVWIGGIVITIGHFTLALPATATFFAGLLCIIAGTGLLKPNISAVVGELYARNDPRRDAGFTLFYMGINLGAAMGPLICSTLGESERFGWHYGFAAAGVGMLIGLVTYLYASPSLPPDAINTPEARTHKPLTGEERRAIGALIVLCVPVVLFWATYEQQGNTIALWADAHTDRSIGLLGWTAEIPVTWFQAFNPFMIFAFTPLIVGLWTRQNRRGREPSTLTKMAFGCFGVALANVILAVGALQAGEVKTSWLWLFAYFVVITIGELYLSPVSLSLVSKISPVRTVSLMMGVWLLTSFFGNFLAGFLGSFWSAMDKPTFFLLIAGIAAVAGAAIAVLRRPFRDLLER